MAGDVKEGDFSFSWQAEGGLLEKVALSRAMQDEQKFAREEGRKGIGEEGTEKRVPAVFGERSGWIKGEDLEVAGLDVTRGQGRPKRGQRPGPQAAALGGQVGP